MGSPPALGDPVPARPAGDMASACDGASSINESVKKNLTWPRACDGVGKTADEERKCERVASRTIPDGFQRLAPEPVVVMSSSILAHT